MPRYTKQNGDKVPNVRTEKAWYTIPVKMPVSKESYLIQPRVADYIDLLENKILKLGYELPKLSVK